MIGRSREADLTIAHPMISRRHCEVFEVDGLLMVRDLGSLNGTLVGGQRVKQSPLPPDAEFTVGPLTFRAQYNYAGDRHALPAAVVDGKAAAAPPSAAETVASELQTVEAPPAAVGENLDEDDIVDFLTVLGNGVDDAEEPKPESAAAEKAEQPAPTAKTQQPARKPATPTPAKQATETIAATKADDEPEADLQPDEEEDAETTADAQPAAAKGQKKGSWLGGLLGSQKKKEAKPVESDAKSTAKAALEPAAKSEPAAAPKDEADDEAAMFAAPEARPADKAAADATELPDDLFDEYLNGLK